jgi:hypothetical protein
LLVTVCSDYSEVASGVDELVETSKTPGSSGNSMSECRVVSRICTFDWASGASPISASAMVVVGVVAL